MPAERRTAKIGGVFETMDAPAIWRYAESDASGLLDFLTFFASTENMVCYARCPRSLGWIASTTLSSRPVW